MICHSTSGTHGYLGPEVYAGDHAHGTLADFFAAGVTLHELIMSNRPFDAASLRHAGTPKGSPNLVLCGQGPPEKTRMVPDTASEKYRDYALNTLRNSSLLSNECKDFIASLLIFQVRARLGGLERIQSHPWFRNFNWKLDSRKAPYVPDRADAFPRGACIELTAAEGDSPPSGPLPCGFDADFHAYAYNTTVDGTFIAPSLRVSFSYKPLPEQHGAWDLPNHLRSSFSLSLHSVDDVKSAKYL